MPKRDKTTFTTRLTVHNYDWVHSEAETSGRTQAEIMNAALDSYRLRDALIQALRAAIRVELGRK